jgi:hypothetical protein
MFRRLRHLLTVAALLAPAQLAAQVVDVSQASLAQLQRGASEAYASGQRAQAMALTEAILARAPDDALALFLQTKLWFEARPTPLSQNAARVTARRAYDAAQSKVQRYETSVLAAKIAVSQQRWFAANGWTRLSALNAPNAQAKAQATQDLATVQQINPWQISGGFSIRPSSNVNGGSTSAENRIEGFTAVGVLSTDAMALSGIEATASLSAHYRIATTETSRTTLGALIWTRQVELDGDPMRETVDPSTGGTLREPIESSDFAAVYLRPEMSHLRETKLGRVEVSGHVSRYWQGGDALWTGRGISGRLGFGRDVNWTVSSSLEHRRYINSRKDTLWTFGVERGTEIFQAGHLRTGVVWLTQNSTSANTRMERLRGRVGFTPNSPIAGVSLTAEVSAQRSIYRDYSFLGMHPDGGRRDDTVAMRV